jgi:hypothetical protein
MAQRAAFHTDGRSLHYSMISDSISRHTNPQSLREHTSMNRAALLLFAYLLTCCLVCPQVARPTTGRTRDNITGHYVFRYSNVRSSLNVQLLPNNQIKFSLIALLETGGGTPRNGVVEATVPLKNNTAVYQDGACRIEMKFLNGRVEVKEHKVDDCGFGAFVTAQGTYLRRSRKPRFDS